MAKLMYNNCTVTIRRSAAIQSGSAPTFSETAITATCFAKSISISKTIGTVDVAGLCDTVQKMQITRKSGTLDIELYVDPVAVASGGLGSYIFEGKLGYFVEIAFDADGAAAGLTSTTYTGVITSTSINVGMDDAITERATITLGVNGFGTSGSSDTSVT